MRSASVCARNELEDQGANLPVFARCRFFEAENRTDVGMVQRGEHARLPLEAGDALVVGQGVWQNLDGEARCNRLSKRR